MHVRLILDLSNLVSASPGKIVQVVVGPDEATFNIHENLISSRSSFFEAALRKCWREGRDRRIELPKDWPDTVQLYLQFLYSGKLFIRWTEDESGMKSDDENLPKYFTLAHLYVFGEKVRDFSFKNATMDALVRRMNKKNGGRRCWSPVGKVVDIIYQGPMPESPARLLMLDCHYLRGCAVWITQQPDTNNKEFLVDLTRMLLNGRQTIGSDPPFPTAIERRTYHEDGDGKPIVTRKPQPQPPARRTVGLRRRDSSV